MCQLRFLVNHLLISLPIWLLMTYGNKLNTHEYSSSAQG